MKMQKFNMSFLKECRGRFCHVSVFLFLLCVFFLFPFDVTANENALSPLHSFRKIIRVKVEPNVLMLLDSSGSMAFSDLLSNVGDVAVWGDGSRPFSSQRYYGLDVYDGNNVATPASDGGVNLDYHPKLLYLSNSEVLALAGTTNLSQATNFVSGLKGRASDGGVIDYPEKSVFSTYTDGDMTPEQYALTLGDEASSNGYSKFKYPNDSRLYILKNVMFRLLHDVYIFPNLRLALSTYHQNRSESLSAGGWYTWLPKRRVQWDLPPSSYQSIFWATQNEYVTSSSSDNLATNLFTHRKALLQEPFRSTTISDAYTETYGDHLENLRSWFDGEDARPSGLKGKGLPGTEYENQVISRELRAQGNTPLARSIFDKFGGNSSAYNFFTAEGVITDFCQDNWLIILTDGEDRYSFYWRRRSGRDYEWTTIRENISDAVEEFCKPGRMGDGNRRARAFVIGFVNDKKPAQATLVASLKDAAKKGRWDLPDNDPRKDAYFASNLTELFNVLRSIFFEIQDYSATGGAPLVTPGKVTEDEHAFYQATYQPRSGKQWEGDVVKRVLSEDKTIVEVWSAANLLKNNKARTIVTAFNSVTNPYPIGNTSDFRGVIGIDDQDNAGHFIDWFHNGEVEKDRTYSLFDIYRSGLVKVGAPAGFSSDNLYRDFVTQNYGRDVMIYVQSNAGTLHGFKDINGEEKFAFIPPNVLTGNRLRGLRWDEAGGIYDRINSYPRHLLDGPLIAEDVFAKGKYRTLLMGLLGLGGAGMYVVDVSDAKTPSLLWAVENAIYKNDEAALITDVTKRSVLTWQAKSDIVEASAPYWHTVSDDQFTEKEYNYMKLRHTVSTPFIGRVLLQEAGKDVPEWVWVFIMGNGTSGNVTEDDDGSKKGVIYIGRMEDGKIIERIPVDDAVVSPVAALFEGSRGVIKTFFVGDRAGMLYKGDLSSTSSSEWKDKLQPIFDFQANQGLSYSIDATKIKKQLWVVAGTGDVEDYLGAPGADEQHYFVALNVSDVANIAKFPVKRDTLSALSAESASIAAPLGAGGWRINLLKKTEKFGFERMSTPPFIYKGYVFFSTFRPDLDPCSDSGSSRVYAMKVATGEGVIGDKKYIELPDTLVSGISISKGNLVLGVTRYGSGAVPGFVQVGENMLLMDISWLPNEADDESGLMKPLYWKSR